MAMMADDPEHPDVFLLTDSEHGEAYTHTHVCLYILVRTLITIMHSLAPDPNTTLNVLKLLVFN